MKDPMLSVTEALQRLLGLVQPKETEHAPMTEAVGRGLAEDVLARRTLPPWDNSAMDGYAVRSADVTRAPARLRIVDVIHAGKRPTRTIGAGECARIMTGAPMPGGADAVVMQEKVKTIGDGEIELADPVSPRLNVRDRGEDARAGEPLLKAGAAIGIPEAGLLWAQGLTTAPVPRRPRVAILSSGDELAEVGSQDEQRIVDTNSPSIAEAVRRAGGVPTQLGIAQDTLEAVLARLEQARGYDVVLTSAGVSVGEHDFVRPALEKLGVQSQFWRVALKPGKPLAVGTLGSTLFIGLPGNPVSSLVTFELFVRPTLRRMCGIEDVIPVRYRARLEGRLKKTVGITHYVRAVTRGTGPELRVAALSTQTSGALRSAASATHLIELPAEASSAEDGSEVSVLPVSWVG